MAFNLRAEEDESIEISMFHPLDIVPGNIYWTTTEAGLKKILEACIRKNIRLYNRSVIDEKYRLMLEKYMKEHGDVAVHIANSGDHVHVEYGYIDWFKFEERYKNSTIKEIVA